MNRASRKTMSLKVITLISSLVLVVALTACGGKNNSSSPSPSETQPASNSPQESASSKPIEPVTLSFMFAQTNLNDTMTSLFKKFESENEGYKIDVQTVPDNQWLDVLKTKIATNETPDLVRVDVSKYAELNVDKNFVEIDETTPWVSRVIPTVLTSKQYNGKLYGLPIGSDTAMGLLYNNDVFKKFNIAVPKTYDELLTAAETLKKNNVTPIYATDKDTWTTQIWFTSTAPQAVQPDVWDKLMTNQAKWTDYPEFADLLSKQLELHTKGYTNKDAIATTYDTEAKALADGTAAMAIMGQWLQPDILKINKDADIRIAPIPVGPAKLTLTKGGGVMAIFKNSKHVEQTKVFLDWLSKPENMNSYTESHGDFATFTDQTDLKLTPLQTDIQQYIDSGNVEYEMNPRLGSIDVSELWNLQQGMIAGGPKPEVVLSKWQSAFEKQAKLKQMPGF